MLHRSAPHQSDSEAAIHVTAKVLVTDMTTEPPPFILFTVHIHVSETAAVYERHDEFEEREIEPKEMKVINDAHCEKRCA